MIIKLPYDHSILCDIDDNLIPVGRMSIKLPYDLSIFSGNADNAIPLL
jgi:hypothetical protein